MKARKRQAPPSKWGSSADQWTQGDVSQWGGGTSPGGSSRQTSQRQTRQFWPGMPGGGGSKRETNGVQDSSSNGGSGSSSDGKTFVRTEWYFLQLFLSNVGKEFWGKYASMFGSGGDGGKPPPPGSWSNGSPPSSGGGSASPSWTSSGGSFQGGQGKRFFPI